MAEGLSKRDNDSFIVAKGQRMMRKQERFKLLGYRGKREEGAPEGQGFHPYHTTSANSGPRRTKPYQGHSYEYTLMQSKKKMKQRPTAGAAKSNNDKSAKTENRAGFHDDGAFDTMRGYGSSHKPAEGSIPNIPHIAAASTGIGDQNVILKNL